MPIVVRTPAAFVRARPFGVAHPGLLLAMFLLFLALVGAVAAVVVVRIGLYCPPEGDARSEARTIANAVELYGLKTATTPRSLQSLVPGELRELRADPWGHPYRLVSTSGPGPAVVVVVSDGRDGVPGTDDDVASSARGP